MDWQTFSFEFDFETTTRARDVTWKHTFDATIDRHNVTRIVELCFRTTHGVRTMYITRVFLFNSLKLYLVESTVNHVDALRVNHVG